MQKHFKIDNANYRKISSAAHHLIAASKFKTLFITLTFPKFKKNVPDKELNKYFSRFIANLRKRHNVQGYVAVFERGAFRYRPHYHVLLGIPFIDFRYLNSLWINTISDICAPSKNAVQTDKKTRFIKNPVRAVRYVCKYFSKARGQKSMFRIMFISNNLITEPVHIDHGTDEYYYLSHLLGSYESVYVKKTSEYTTLYRVTNPTDLYNFFLNFIYPHFEIHNKDPGVSVFFDVVIGKS
ncbi:MAG: hypothetical protein U9O65_00765 [Thermotogota bacterium]|nr:hypothetical protein [Thermotogota bacterium]